MRPSLIALALTLSAPASSSGLPEFTMPSAIDSVQAATARLKRLEVVRAIVLEHLRAEDAEDMAAIRKTFAPDAAFEDVARGQVISGVDAILKSYEVKDYVFPPVRRPVTKLIIDEQGAYAEFDRVNKQTGEKYQRVAARFDVNASGLITREVAYYDKAELILLLIKNPTWLYRYIKTLRD